MTARELFEAIGLVDDRLLLEALEPPAAAPRPWLVTVRRLAPLAACLCVALGAILAVRSGVLGGGTVKYDGTAQAPAAAEPEESGTAAGGALAEDERAADLPDPAHYEADSADALADGFSLTDPKEDAVQPGQQAKTAPDAGAPLQSSQVNYWGSQLEPALQNALWGDGEAETWQSVLADLPAAVRPGAEPTALPVLRGQKSVGEYTLLSKADAQALLLDGAFLSAEAVPSGAANPENELAAELVYNPAGAALRVPMWAFTVPTDMAYGDVVCYVPAVDLDLLRQLVQEKSGG